MSSKMKKRYKKLEITVENSCKYGLRRGDSSSSSRNTTTTTKRKQIYSVFLLGLGVVVCIFCYASYFPAGVVWINPTSTFLSTTNNNPPVSSNNNKMPSGLDGKQSPSSSEGSFKSFWKFWSSTSPSHQINQSKKKFVPKHFSVTAENEESDGEKQISFITEERRSCNFPRLNPFDPSIREFIKDPPNVDCFANYPLVFRTNFKNKLIQMKKLEKNTTCCYKTITRGNASDHNIKYSKKCHEIINLETEIPATHEFISIKCTRSFIMSNSTSKLTTSTVHKDMMAFVSLKPSVESRIKSHELLMNLKNNKHSTEEHQQQTKNEDKLSVLILGLDAQSHMNFMRQMPLTYNFLVKNLSAIGLQGYTKVGDNTFPNVVPLISGLNVAELKRTCWPTKLSYFDGCPFIWKKFSSQGYRTSFAEDSIWMSTFNYEKKGFLNPPTDYYFHPLSLLMSKKIGHQTWGNSKLCYGPRLAFEVLLDYIVKTSVTFKDKLYFQFVWANSLFHDYLNNPKLGDELLHLTLDYLSKNGYLNNTVLLLLSDHGIRWGSIRSTYQGKIEERMPLAYFVFPPWFHQKYSQAIGNLVLNAAARLTTPFDIYETLLDILETSRIRNNVKRISKEKNSFSNNNSDEIPRGISLFRPIPRTRMCKSAGIEEHWCVCNSMKAIPRNSSLAKSAANFIVQSINKGLKKFTSCAKLRLFKINESMRKIDGDIDKGLEYNVSSSTRISTTSPIKDKVSASSSSDNILINNNKNESKTENHESDSKGKKIQLQITLVTKPGDAVLEGTVYGNFAGDSWNISGDISRLNIYREQSICISDYIAQKYCFCLNQADNNDD